MKPIENIELKDIIMTPVSKRPAIYLVHNGGEYDDYAVLALFTDQALAAAYAEAADGVVEEWPRDVPPDEWCFGTARLHARKENESWVVNVNAFTRKPDMGPISVKCLLGHYSGWGEPDPKSGRYTRGHAIACARTSEQAEKMCLDAFWQRVAELDAQQADGSTSA